LFSSVSLQTAVQREYSHFVACLQQAASHH
jgi:hypothetical protein